MYTSIELLQVRGRYSVIALLVASVLGCSHPGLTSSVAPVGEKFVAEGFILPPDTTGVDKQIADLRYVYLPVKIHGKAMTVKADLGAYGGLYGTVSSTSTEPGIPVEYLRGTAAMTLEIGTAVEPDVSFTGSADFTDAPAGMPPLAGVLGNEVLSRYDIVLDGPAGRARLYAPPDGATTAGASRGDRSALLPPGFKPEDCIPMEGGPGYKGVLITLRANGHVVRGIIDTGSWATNMNVIAARTLGFTDTNPKVHPRTEFSMNSVQSRSEVAAGAVTLSLGTQHLTSVPVMIFDAITVPGTGDEPVLNVGMNVIQDRVLFVSYSTKQVCLGKHK